MLHTRFGDAYTTERVWWEGKESARPNALNQNGQGRIFVGFPVGMRQWPRESCRYRQGLCDHRVDDVGDEKCAADDKGGDDASTYIHSLYN